jgi:hypothetical protein
MNLNNQFFQNPRNEECLVKVFEPSYVLFVFIARSNQCYSHDSSYPLGVDLDEVSIFDVRVWFFDPEWESAAKNNICKNECDKIPSAARELDVIGFIHNLTIIEGSQDITGVPRAVLISMIETFEEYASKQNKKNIKCVECGGTGIIDMGFYKRECMNQIHGR